MVVVVQALAGDSATSNFSEIKLVHTANPSVGLSHISLILH